MESSSRRYIGQRARTTTSARQSVSSVIGQETKIARSRTIQLMEMGRNSEEFTNNLITSIREEIIQGAMDIVHKDYLMKRSVSFIVECAHTAWLQLFNWMHLKHDPGENALTVKERWVVDKEPAPATKDTWTFGNVPIRKNAKLPSKSKSCEEPCKQEEVSCILPVNMPPATRQESSRELSESPVTKV